MLTFIMLILVNIMWSVQYSAAKIATAQLGPITVTVITMALSLVMMAPFLALRKRRPNSGQSPQNQLRHNIFGFVLLGTFGIVVSQLLLTWGISRSLASNAAVITMTTPVDTAVLAFFLLGERMTRIRWISFVLAIAGVLMVSDIDWRSVKLLQGKYLAGNLLLFLSCWGASFYNTYAKKLLRRFTPFEVTVYSFTVCTLVLLPLRSIFEPMPWSRWTSLSWPVWISLAAIALFSLTLATVLFFAVLQDLDVTQAIISVYMSTVFGVIIASIAVHERITATLLFGGGLVVVSTFLVTYYEQRPRTSGKRLQTGVNRTSSGRSSP